MKLPASKEPAMLVVLERGAQWPSWVDRHRTGEDTVVIAQQSDETLRELLDRVQRTADKLSGRNRCIRTAVYALRANVVVEARTERALIACSVLRHVCTRDGAFVLCADSPAAGERHELLTLCGALTEALTGKGTAVLAVLDARPPTNEWQRPPALGVRVRGASGAAVDPYAATG